MFKAVLPQLINLFLSKGYLSFQRNVAEFKRKVNKRPHQLDVFIAINDPHSYLLLQIFPQLQQQFNLSIQFHTILNRQPEMFPEVKRWDNNAWQDAQFLATVFQLDFPQIAPKHSNKAVHQVTAQLLQHERQANFQSKALVLFNDFWFDKIPPLADESQAHEHINNAQRQLLNNEKYLEKLSHYLAGTIYYGGEWYWGLNRLFHLEQRLNNLLGDPTKPLNFDRLTSLCKGNAPLKIEVKNRAPLTIYWSIRSPYSYLGLIKAINIAHHYQLPLQIKPVLPMVMRGRSVPRSKKVYILKDTNRETHEYGIAFGKVADPLGEGVKRCYALFEYAKSQEKEVEYLKTFAESVWALGIRSDTDRGLK